MSKTVKIGNVLIGSGNKIAVQTMANVKTSNICELLKQIESVTPLGVDIFRVAVKDEADALSIKEIKKNSSIPLVADIHFDYKLALMAIDNGVDKVRINPGNIGSEQNIKQVALAIKNSGIAVRVGSNTGSIKKEFLEKYGKNEISLAESALENVSILEKYGVDNIVISVKASSVDLMVKANRYLSQKTNYPLHIGVTEAGTKEMGVIKNSIGIGSLLLDGIGDTIRVSLTAPITDEVIAAHQILRSVGLEKNFVEVISCPTCGRTAYNSIDLASEVEKMTSNYQIPLKVAVMGCVVNGPGEAKDADIGIAGGEGKCVIFKKGKVYKTVLMSDARQEFLKEIEKLIKENNEV